MRTESADAGSADARQHFMDFVKEEVTAEEQRRASLEARGMSLVTVAGTLVTALTAVGAVVTKQAAYVPSSAERGGLIVGVCALIGAIAFGVATNAPRRTSLVDPEAVLEMARKRWSDPEKDIQATVLASQAAHLGRVQRANDAKGAFLLFGMTTLALAAVALGVAAIAALSR